jgi:hypothetical protein
VVDSGTCEEPRTLHTVFDKSLLIY